MPSRLELTLTPHELFALPPDTPATGEAIRVEVTPDDRPSFFALARLVVVFTNKKSRKHYRVFFRNEQHAENELLCGFVFSTHTEEDASTPEQLLRLTIQGANSETLTRFWKSPELSYGLALSSEGFGRVLTPGILLDSTSDFRWENQAESQLLTWGTHHFHAFCEGLTSTPSSELNFFFDWQKRCAEEKTEYVTRCEHGDWEQMVCLLTWVLQLATHHFGVYPYAFETSSYWQFMHVDFKYECGTTFFLRRWQNAILNIICPLFWPDEPLCCSKWRNRQTNVERDVTCSVPTAHEFMEAQLELREFLRPHLSEGEIEALFVP